MKGATRGAMKVARIAALQEFAFGDSDHSGLSDDESMDKHEDELHAQLSRSPDQKANDIKPILDHAPELGAQLLLARERALSFLNGNMSTGSKPSQPSGLPLDPRNTDEVRSRTPGESAQMAHKMQLVTDPTVALDRASEGSLTAQDVQTLRAVYPKLYSEMVVKTMSRLASLSSDERRSVSPAELEGLSTLVGSPLVGSQRPDVVQGTYQSIYGSGASVPVGPKGNKPPRKGPSKGMKTLANMSTPDQADSAALEKS